MVYSDKCNVFHVTNVMLWVGAARKPDHNGLIC